MKIEAWQGPHWICNSVARLHNRQRLSLMDYQRDRSSGPTHQGRFGMPERCVEERLRKAFPLFQSSTVSLELKVGNCSYKIRKNAIRSHPSAQSPPSSPVTIFCPSRSFPVYSACSRPCAGSQTTNDHNLRPVQIPATIPLPSRISTMNLIRDG